MTERNPTVTVVMPVYNGARYLSESIEAILNQDFTDFEFLIIDDGSTDNSIDIIRSYHDSRIRLVQNEGNLGLTRTLNRSLRLAKAVYIARIDQDDVSMKTRLQRQINYMKNHQDIKLVGTWSRIIDENNGLIKVLRPPTAHQRIVNSFVYCNPFAHSTVLFSLDSVLQMRGYPSEFSHAQDYALWLKLSTRYKVANIPEELVRIRYHSNRATNLPHLQTSVAMESIRIYEEALLHPDLFLSSRLYGKARLILKPWVVQDYLRKRAFSRKLYHYIRAGNWLSKSH